MKGFNSFTDFLFNSLNLLKANVSFMKKQVN